MAFLDLPDEKDCSCCRFFTGELRGLLIPRALLWEGRKGGREEGSERNRNTNEDLPDEKDCPCCRFFTGELIGDLIPRALLWERREGGREGGRKGVVSLQALDDNRE